MNNFSFPAFEQEFLGPERNRGNIFEHYERYINYLTKREQLGTASTYRCSMSSLKRFIKEIKGSDSGILLFSDIDKDFLEDYEYYMSHTLERSPATIGIYIRPIRTLFNQAQDRKDIPPDFFPFGRNKYIIPSSSSNKRPLEPEDLVKMKTAKADPLEEKARDFWLLSYLLSGANISDIISLKYGENLKEDEIVFIRNKTKRTSKANSRMVVVPLIDSAKAIIDKYRNNEALYGDYVFDVLHHGMSAKEIRRETQNFTRFINQHLKRLAKKAGFPNNISLMWARHTYATNMINNNAPVALISENIGHSNIRTTENYLAGFNKETKLQFQQKLEEALKNS